MRAHPELHDADADFNDAPTCYILSTYVRAGLL